MSYKKYNDDLAKGLEVIQLEERLEMVQVSAADAAAESFALDSPGGGTTIDTPPPAEG